MLTHRAVLFDLDGTLLDPVTDVAAAVNHMCRALGIPERTREQVTAGMGRGLKHLLTESIPENSAVSLEAAEKSYREYYGEHFLDSSAPYDGILDMLASLKNDGAKTAVISNKAHEYTTKICDALFKGYIDVCIGEMPELALKPDPASVFGALRALGENANNAVYVGDTDVDMETAKNAQLQCITCAWGLRGKDFLLEHGADPRLIAEAPADVCRILRCGPGKEL